MQDFSCVVRAQNSFHPHLKHPHLKRAQLQPSHAVFRTGHIPKILWLLVVLPLLFINAFGQSDPSIVGQWSAVQNWPYRAVHTVLLPNGNVMFYSYYAESQNPQVWNPTTNKITPTATINYNIFCSGHSLMSDGKVLVTGGHQADYVGFPYASIYDPYANTWHRVPDMNAGRWYPSNTTLANGNILVLSGDISSNTSTDNLPQVWQPATGSWQNLTSAQLSLPLYPRMFLAPNGKVFKAGPDRTSRYLTTTGTGAWSTVATTNFTGWRDYGSIAMYDAGKILTVGGGDPPTNSAEIIDLNSGTPAWKWVGAMHTARRQLNATVLPDGTVLITGGSSGSGFDNASAPARSAELWNPATGTFTVLASNTIYRGYHSTALLLPDGRVLSAGGNVGGPNAEIFSPPYLFKGARPTISSAPNLVGYGQTFFVGTASAASVTKVTLVRLGAVTHSFDMNARFLRLNFTSAANGLTVTAPASANIAPPGHYMLFLVNGTGVPSIASIVQISSAPSTSGTVAGIVTNASGAAIAGATVTASTQSTSTNSTGNYTLGNVPTGNVQVTAAASGFQSSTQTVAVTSGNTATANFSLSAAAVGSVTGIVKDSATATPLASVTVAFSGGSSTTDGSGSYTLSNVPAGQVQVTATVSGYQSSSQTVSVTQNLSSTANFNLTKQPTGSISGHVTNTSGASLAGATIAYGAASTSTDTSGNYAFLNVLVGTVQVTVNLAGYQSAAQNVTVTQGTNSVANFQLTKTASVSGRVTSIVNGQALASATVSYTGGGSAITNSTGNYVFNSVSPGTYTFTANRNGYLSRSSSVSISTAPVTLNFQLSTAGKIGGTVKTTGGAAISGATVKLSGGVIATSITLTTNTSGSYLSTWIPVGNYTITVTKTGYTTSTKSTSVSAGVTSAVNFTM